MKRRQLNTINLESKPAEACFEKNKEFIKNLETAILLSLLAKGQITKWQFDFCIDELKKQPYNSSNQHIRRQSTYAESSGLLQGFHR